MNKSIQIILEWISSEMICFTLFSIVIFNTIFGCQSKKPSQGLDTVESKSDSVFFVNSKVKITLMAKTWGIAGNHEQINIFGNLSFDTIKLFTSEAYYKKVGSDSLVVYAPQSAIPAEAKSNIGEVKVHLIGLNTQAEIIDYSANYQDYNLIRISAINK